MPGKDVTPMNQKLQFVSLAATGRFSVTQLCEDFDISRKTGHKWLGRYAAHGPKGLGDVSRRPHGCCHQTPAEVLALLLKERKAHPMWGPKKIQDLLVYKHGIESPPARSTIASLLSQHGLIKRRRRKPGVYHGKPSELTEPVRANHVWTFDYKGWFLTQDRVRCDPLTVCDRFSRYIVGCQARLDQQFNGTYAATRKMMRHHGLPEIIRVDFGFKRNIFLDSDILCLKEAPALIAPGTAPLRAALDTGFQKTRAYKGHPNEINSGVLSIGRALQGPATIARLQDLARTHPGRGGYNAGDQGILNKWIHADQIEVDLLPPEYNLIKKNYADIEGLEDCRLLHFAGHKPWLGQQRNDTTRPASEALDQLWNDAPKVVEKEMKRTI